MTKKEARLQLEAMELSYDHWDWIAGRISDSDKELQAECSEL